MTVAFHLTVLVSLLALIYYIWTAAMVGRARARHGVKAPSTDGPEGFLCAFRLQQNTLEQLVLFLPVLWLAYISYNSIWPAFVGAVWLLGRVIYAYAYLVAGPQKRGPGFLLTFLSSLVLLLAVLLRSIMGLI